MKITQEADYGLRVVLFLCKLGYGEKIEAKAISSQENIPIRFLLKLLRKLTMGNIIKSYRGIHGGYSINKQPEDITLREVIECIDGPICVNRCIYNPDFCTANRTAHCVIHKALSEIKQTLVNDLEKKNFKDLIEGN
jgi:Rrf2 family protein